MDLLVRGGLFRIMEIINILVINPIDIIINSIKTIWHFIVHSFKKEYKINELTDLNLKNYYFSSVLLDGIFGRLDLSHKRTAVMYELFMQLSLPSPK